jgi:hypothetical protein
MPVFLSDQLKDAGVIRIEILKYLISGNKRFLLWVTEMDNQSMVHEFSSLLSIDTFTALSEDDKNEEISNSNLRDYSTILLTRLDDDEESSLESVSIGCFDKEAAKKLRDFIKGFVLSSNGDDRADRAGAGAVVKRELKN